jgi:hypothetical protein
MMTPFGLYQPLVLPTVAADGGGITAFEDRAEGLGSSWEPLAPQKSAFRP